MELGESFDSSLSLSLWIQSQFQLQLSQTHPANDREKFITYSSIHLVIFGKIVRKEEKKFHHIKKTSEFFSSLEEKKSSDSNLEQGIKFPKINMVIPSSWALNSF